jgi:hypothetical protein
LEWTKKGGNPVDKIRKNRSAGKDGKKLYHLDSFCHIFVLVFIPIHQTDESL